MKRYPVFFIIFLLGMVLISGCAQPPPRAVENGYSGAPAPVVSEVNTTTNVTLQGITPGNEDSTIPMNLPDVTVSTTEVPPSLASPKPVKTTHPPADPTDVSEITFLQYSDSDFSVDYPSTWNITHSKYISYRCRNFLDTTSPKYRICYQQETKTIGPFNFFNDSNYKEPSRIVTFSSADGKMKFVAFTKDFVDSVSGNVLIKPTSEWCHEQVGLNFPDMIAADTLGNYQFSQSGSTMTTTYDVILPTGSKFYPLAYTKKDIVTMRHLFSMGFITDNENFSKYQNLRNTMLSSVKTIVTQ